jgi:hypothetical protein
MDISASEPEPFSTHSLNSTLRENILEHLFIGELLRTLWQWGVTDTEVLRSEFDAGGYDLVLSRGTLTRHVQLKSVLFDGKAANVKVSRKLASRSSGCVVWLVVSPNLEVVDVLYFGGTAGNPLPRIEGFTVAKHTKANADGVKLERQEHRVVPRGKFERVGSISNLIPKLLGIAKGNVPAIRKPVSLDELLDRVTPENIHTELEWGLPVGRELW